MLHAAMPTDCKISQPFDMDPIVLPHQFECYERSKKICLTMFWKAGEPLVESRVYLYNYLGRGTRVL